MYWRLRQWILQGGKLKKHDGWRQLLDIKYKPDGSSGRIKMMGKEEMLRNGIQSPDCFIAGTKILTDNGEKIIESLNVGDIVITPFGNRYIVKKWIVETDKLIKVSFSNGKVLIGKPKHKILTNRGFISLDSLLLTDRIEIKSSLSNLLWTIKKLLFIKERNIGLRQQADIFMPIYTMDVEEKQEQKKRYIIEFGKIIIIKKFLLDIVFIIKIIIHKIIPLKILNWLKVKSINIIICYKDLQIKNIKKKIIFYLKKYAHLLYCGINRKKEENGIVNMEKKHGKIEKLLQLNVLNVEKKLLDILKQKNFVVEVVLKNHFGKIKNIIQTKGFVYFVKKNLWQTGIGIQNVVVESVETITEPNTKVYNLTLNKDNVYYANGILVENCSDALSLTFARQDENMAFKESLSSKVVVNPVRDDPYESKVNHLQSLISNGGSTNDDPYR
jgi:hypothetical protein